MTLTYKRRLDIIELTGMIDEHFATQISLNTFVTSKIQGDFRIRADKLLLEGELSEPKRGDIIEFTDTNSFLHIFEVTPGNGEKVFSWADTYRYQFIVHATLTSSSKQ